jgi:hypothetical protein
MMNFDESFMSGFEDGLDKIAAGKPVKVKGSGKPGLWDQITGAGKRYGQLMAGGKKMGKEEFRPGNVIPGLGKKRRMGSKQKAERTKSMLTRGATGATVIGGAGLTALLSGGKKDKKKEKK